MVSALVFQSSVKLIMTLYKPSVSFLQEFSHELVDFLWSILLHPMTAVSNVPTERKRERERERERGGGWDWNSYVLWPGDNSNSCYYTVELP